MNKIIVSVSFCLLFFGGNAYANLCKGNAGGGHTPVDVKNDVDFYQQLFPDSAYWGNRTWNEIIVECNRMRDKNGNEVSKITGSGNSGDKTTLLASDLEAKVIRGHYNFFSDILFQQKYVYVLSKEKGMWTMTIPYSAIINDVVANRIDFLIGARPVDPSTDSLGTWTKHTKGNAWKVFDGSQVIVTSTTTKLKVGAKPIAETLCTTSTYFSGKENKYKGQNDVMAYKRDAENKFISLGKLQYGYKKSDGYIWEGCRVDKDQVLYWQPDPTQPDVSSTTAHEFILDNFQRVVEGYWTIPGVFQLKLLLKGRNEAQFPKTVRDLLRDDDRLTAYFVTKFPAHGFNQMYKSNPVQFNNFSTMTRDDVYHHEVGHAFGLDDEYSQFNEKTDANSCENSRYSTMSSTYIMCVVLSISEGNALRTIYPYTAVSRYITKQSQCKTDNDCGSGRYCDAGADFDKNQCVALKADNSTCDIAGGGHQCQSGHCNLGRCYTPNSVIAGGTCYNDDACMAGKCSSIDGTKGTCVCKKDSDCGVNMWCDAGADFNKNTCRAKLKTGAACGVAGSLGNNHKCKSDKCSGFPNYVCK